MRLVILFCLALIAVADTSRFSWAEDKVPHVLFVTQSKGFVHQPVKRQSATRSPAELAMMQLAADTGQFTIRCTQDAAADFNRETLGKIRPDCSA